MRGDQRIGHPVLFVVEPLHWPARQNGETSAVIEIVMRLGQKRRGPGQRVERAVDAPERQASAQSVTRSLSDLVDPPGREAAGPTGWPRDNQPGGAAGRE